MAVHCRPVNVDLIIKFGGSAITDKNSLETLRPQQLAAAAQCIRRCKDSGLTCIIVHGAGSFGHHQAKEYQVNFGLTASETVEEQKEKIWGYCLTRQSVTKLNQFVINSLIDAGVPAVACSPGSSWETDNRQPVKWPSSCVSELLSKGFVPVFHGDCCIDASLGCCILSGDTVIKTLCSFFMVKRVIFLTDVAGVYDKPPDQPGAQLLKTIQVHPDGSIKGLISVSQSKHDVTGGLMLKLKTAVDIVIHSKGECQVYVCAVDSPDATTACLETTHHSGDLNATRIFLAIIEDS